MEPSPRDIEALRAEVAELRMTVQRLSALITERLPAPYSRTFVLFGEGCKIAPQTVFIGNESSPIRIGNKVTIRRGAEIIGDVQIGHEASINRDVYIRSNTRIGNRVNIGPFVRLITDAHTIRNNSRRAGAFSQPPITVEDGVWIGASVTILGGVTIGEGSVIAAGALVNRDVPANSVVAGVPAKVIRYFDTPL